MSKSLYSSSATDRTSSKSMSAPFRPSSAMLTTPADSTWTRGVAVANTGGTTAAAAVAKSDRTAA